MFWSLLFASFCTVSLGEPQQFHVALCSATYSKWGTQDAMSLFLGLEYWHKGPKSLAGALKKPADAEAFNVTVSTINSGCSGQTSFENTMKVFGDSSTRPDVIIGCICSGASTSVGRFSTTFNVPMLVTTSQSSALSDKSQYPYIFRYCTTELTDADVHAGLLSHFGSKKATVIYTDSQRGALQKDRFARSPSMQDAEIITIRLPEADMKIQETYTYTVTQLQQALRSSSWMVVCYFATGFDDNKRIAIEAMGEAGILNNHAVFFFPEVMMRFIVEEVPKELQLGMIGSFVGRAKVVPDRFQAYQDWTKTIDVETLKSIGFKTTSPDDVVLDDSWTKEPEQLAPWMSFRFEATFSFLLASHSLKKSGVEWTSEAFMNELRNMPVEGIFGDVSWDANQNRQGLVYEIKQLHQPENLVTVGDVELTPGPDGRFRTSFAADLLQFRYGKGELTEMEAPPCYPGTAKPHPFLAPSECIACPKGKYSSNETDGQCLPCSAGLFGPEEGMSRCSACEPGTYNEVPGSSTCSLCPIGMTTSSPAAAECEPCALGFFSGNLGAVECSRCSMGKYSNQSGSTSCSACPVNEGFPMSTLFQAATGKQDCVCPENAYLSEDEVCVDCPPGMTCAKGSSLLALRAQQERRVNETASDTHLYPVVLPGHWSEPEEPLSVFLCRDENACPGGLPGSCGPLMSGIACAVCENEYFLDEGQCVPCNSIETSKVLFPVMPVVFGPLVVILMYNKMQDPVEKWGSGRNGVGVALYLLINHYQVLALIRSCNLKMPSSIHSVWKTWSFLVDFASILRPDCAGYADFSGGMVVRVLLPILGLLIFLMVFLGSHIVAHFKPDHEGMNKNIIFNCYMTMIYTFFIGIAALSLELFKCYDHPNGEKSLSAAPEIICQSKGWNDLVVVAVFAILIYCVGAFCIYTRVLLIAPNKFHEEEFRQRWKFLLAKFRPSTWWWGIIVLLKSLLLNFAMIVSTGGADQLTWINIVVLLYTAGLTMAWPWRHNLANMVDLGAQGALCFVVQMATRFAGSQEEISNVTLANMVLFVSFTPFLAFGIAAVRMIQREQWPDEQKQEHATDATKKLVDVFGSLTKLTEADVQEILLHLPDYDWMILAKAQEVISTEFMGNNSVQLLRPDGSTYQPRRCSRGSISLASNSTVSSLKAGEQPSSESIDQPSSPCPSSTGAPSPNGNEESLDIEKEATLATMPVVRQSSLKQTSTFSQQDVKETITPKKVVLQVEQSEEENQQPVQHLEESGLTELGGLDELGGQREKQQAAATNSQENNGHAQAQQWQAWWQYYMTQQQVAMAYAVQQNAYTNPMISPRYGEHSTGAVANPFVHSQMPVAYAPQQNAYAHPLTSPRAQVEP